MLPQGTRPGFSIPLFAFGGMLCAIAALLGISLGTGWMVGPHMCLSNDPVFDQCIQDFPWTLSLHRRWCPSASHHPLTFLFLLALTFPLPSPFPPLGLSLCRPPCPSASPHSFPSLSLGRLCQRSPRTCPVSLLCVESTQRKANAFAVGQVRPSGHPKPAVRYLSPTAAAGPWDGHLRGGGGGKCPWMTANNGGEG